VKGVTRHKENRRLEELSAAIDALNRGRRPSAEDEETRELAAVALLLKQSAPFPAAVDGLAEKLSAELAARKRRRRWLMSGTAGTAAAALLVFALNYHPGAPPPPLALPPAGSVTIERVPAPAAGRPPAAEAPPAQERAAGAKPETAGSDGPPAQAVPPPAEAPPGQDKPVAAAAEPEPGQKRMMLAEKVDTALSKPADPQVAMLTWPGHQPDSVTVDREAGVVRQVYGTGDGEVVVTQRSTNRAKVMLPEVGKSASPSGVSGLPGPRKVNRVTLTVKGIVVTVEGSRPEEELWKIAQSLE